MYVTISLNQSTMKVVYKDVYKLFSSQLHLEIRDTSSRDFNKIFLFI